MRLHRVIVILAFSTVRIKTRQCEIIEKFETIKDNFFQF